MLGKLCDHRKVRSLTHYLLGSLSGQSSFLLLPPLLFLPCLLGICNFICIYDVCHDVVDSWGAHVPLNALKSKEACGSRIGSGKNLDIPKQLDFFPLAVQSDSSKPCVVCPVVTWFCNSWFPWDFLNANHLGGLSRLILSCSLAACPGLSWFKDLTVQLSC